MDAKCNCHMSNAKSRRVFDAACRGERAMLDALEAWGWAARTALDRHANTPLHVACTLGMAECVEWIE